MGFSLKQSEQIAQLLIKYHGTQVDKVGKPYYHHPIAVSNNLPIWVSNSARLAAYFHDLLEDTDITLDILEEDLAKINITLSPYAKNLIQLLNNKHKKYIDYIEDILATNNLELICIKYSDMSHNTAKDRMAKLDEFTRNKLIRKYEYAFPTIKKKLNNLVEFVEKEIFNYFDEMQNNCNACIKEAIKSFNIKTSIKCNLCTNTPSDGICLTKYIFVLSTNTQIDRLQVFVLLTEIMYNKQSKQLINFHPELGGNYECG
jgi:Guanosine polyphosphate pyrophosphohydrolases/synthetases